MSRKIAACAAALLAAAAASAQERVLDDFEQLRSWKAVVSDGIEGALSQAPGHAGQAMRIDFDLGASGGYVAARRALPLDFEGDYEISFWMRADAPVNNFELKLVDASGENVWWVSRPDFPIPATWRKYVFKKRHIAFAWGPAKDRTLRHAEHLEFVVSTGRDGGHGSVYIDDLAIRRLPPAGPAPAPALSASSGRPGPGLLAGEGAWSSEAGGEQWLEIDFGRAREFGGLVLHWAPGAHASRYEVQFSDDGSSWRTVREVRDGNGGRDPILLTESETRYLRVVPHAGPGGRYTLARLELRPLAFGATENAFFQALAQEAPRGSYPRGMSGEQNYWTVLGVDGGSDTGLLSEDGALEVARGGFSIEPFVIEQGRLRSWADVKVSQSLQEGYLPIPSVTWDAGSWQLRTTAFAHGTAERARLVSRYQLRNDGDGPQTLRLVLALRPFQVNPPMQFLNTPPGVSRIASIAWQDGRFEIDGRPRVFVPDRPDAAGVSSFDADAIPSALAGDGWTARRHVEDGFGFAAGALAYDFTLAPHASAEVALAVPLGSPSDEAPPAAKGWAQAAQDEVAGSWRRRLNEVTLQVPPQGRRLVDTLRSSLAHMLMTRAGPALRPGTRSYARSWIRDGAMMSEGMLRLGNDQVARDYARWFAPYQFESGKVPCCVDRRGADPVPENDSQGEFIFLAAELWRYTRDRALLQEMWPRVLGAAAYMERQRQSGRGAANRTPARRHMFGLLPPSISHEGYSAKPMHSYWDDFWGLRGYRDAAMLAGALGKKEDENRLQAQGDEFERELLASLRRTARVHRIGYLAGAADLGDFDATSTTIALSPGRLQRQLPQDLLRGTFERYWREFVERRDGGLPWTDYTPYELRNVAAFVRLGWRERAHELLDFFMRDRRPEAWNQWAEVVGRLPREPRFVGDMPHGWISSDYIRSALDLFAYERDADRALVIADGIPAAWLAGEGIAVRKLRTPYGQLGYSMRQRAGTVTVELYEGLALPPGGIVLRAPDAAWSRGHTTVDGKPARWRHGELRVRALPARIAIVPAPGRSTSSTTPTDKKAP
jgi:F5/8 type C domain